MAGGLDASGCPSHRVRANKVLVRAVDHADREEAGGDRGGRCDGVNAWSIVMDACAMHRMTHPGRCIASVSNRDETLYFPMQQGVPQVCTVGRISDHLARPAVSGLFAFGQPKVRLIFEVGDSTLVVVVVMSCVACCHSLPLHQPIA